MIILIENGAAIDVVDKENRTALCLAAGIGDIKTCDGIGVEEGHVRCILLLICFGVEIDEIAINRDCSGLLLPINERLRSLRNGKRIGTSLMGYEERRFMWNLAFCFTIAHREAAFKGYYAIRSFITFHGIFMASGYELGEDSVWNDSKWRKEVEESEEESDFAW